MFIIAWCWLSKFRISRWQPEVRISCSPHDIHSHGDTKHVISWKTALAKCFWSEVVISGCCLQLSPGPLLLHAHMHNSSLRQSVSFLNDGQLKTNPQIRINKSGQWMSWWRDEAIENEQQAGNWERETWQGSYNSSAVSFPWHLLYWFNQKCCRETLSPQTACEHVHGNAFPLLYPAPDKEHEPKLMCGPGLPKLPKVSALFLIILLQFWWSFPQEGK